MYVVFKTRRIQQHFINIFVFPVNLLKCGLKPFSAAQSLCQSWQFYQQVNYFLASIQKAQESVFCPNTP